MEIIIAQGLEYITEESYLNSDAEAAETLSPPAAGPPVALLALMLADLPSSRWCGGKELILSGQSYREMLFL